MADTRIEWATKVWNPVTGCTPISEGCAHCYAARMAARLAGRCGYYHERPFRITMHPDRLIEPYEWRKTERVFVCSMGDLFHEEVGFEYVEKVFAKMIPSAANWYAQHIFMVLTKRPEWMKMFIQKVQITHPNIWLGVTAENQRRADERIPVLLDTPASCRFVSVEPMLEAVNLFCWLPPYGQGWTDRPNLDWVIVGCETGPGARPCKIEWMRAIRDQCKAAGVPLFVKKIRLEDGRISGDMSEWPEDLRIRQFPEVNHGHEHRSSEALLPGGSPEHRGEPAL